MRRSACSGKAWGDGTATAISGDRSLKTSRCGRVGASERSGLARGDVTGGGGVCRLHGEARGAWWAWWQRTTAAALCSGEERRGRGEGEQRVRERREGHQGGFVASWWREGEARERLGGSRRWPRRHRRSPPSCFGARGGRRQGGGGGLGRPGGGGAGPATGKWPRYFLLSLSFISISVLFSFI